MKPQHDRGTVAVFGQAQVVHWTERALERAGFQIVNNTPDYQINIQDGEKVLWRVEHSETVRQHTSIYDLIKSLLEKSD